MGTTHTGTCPCGGIRFTVTGAPELVGYCHCKSCKAWSGDPIHAFTIWSIQDVTLTDGEEHLATFHESPESLSHRKFCSKCGGHVMIHHPDLGVYDVFPEVIPTFEFKPTMHINYASTTLRVVDGLPKFRDFPKEYSQFGGTGETMAE